MTTVRLWFDAMVVKRVKGSEGKWLEDMALGTIEIELTDRISYSTGMHRASQIAAEMFNFHSDTLLSDDKYWEWEIVVKPKVR